MEDIHDIKEPLTLSYNYLPLIIFFGGLLLLALLLLFLSFRKKLSPPVKQRLNKKLSPREKAIKELEKIKEDNLIKENKFDLFYDRITNIIKKYLSEQYNLETDSKTTTEIILQLKAMNLDFEFVKQLEICLKDFDFAKYSSYKMTSKDMNESMALTYTLVNRKI